MADKQISDLTSASALTDGSLFVLEQGGAAMKANWGMMKNYISPGVAPQYSTSAKYNVGDYVIYNGNLYRCTTAITTAESWTAAHWTAVVLCDDVGELKSALNESGISIYPNGLTSDSRNGIAYTRTGYTISAIGTSTNFSFCNVYILSLPAQNIGINDTIYIEWNSTNADKLYPELFLSSDGGNTFYATYTKDGIKNKIFLANCNFLVLRVRVPESTTLNESIAINIQKYPTNNAVGKVLATNSSIADYTNEIVKTLTNDGVCNLGKGIYYISELQMPDDTIIRGCGDSTVLTVADDSNGIKVGANCTVENIKIRCLYNRPTVSTRGNGSGILIQGNYDSAPTKGNTKINNVTIENFSCGGIRGVSTGYFVANTISATNCKIFLCTNGILLEDYCEYNRFTNCLCYGNYIGANIYSGNNVLANCSLSNNSCGVYIDGTDADLGGNNSHGALIGCTINHTSGNNGYAVIIKGASNGYLFDGCYMLYGKFTADTGSTLSAGVLVSNCILSGGSNNQIYNWGANALIFNSCLFFEAPTITGNKTTIKNNCYTYDGTPVT